MIIRRHSTKYFVKNFVKTVSKLTELARFFLAMLLAVVLLSTAGLSQERYTGVWKQGSAHKIWTDANWTSFLAKWRELSGQNYRLSDIEILGSGSAKKYFGIWMAGSDNHKLLTDMDWTSLTSNWRDFKNQNLRLIDIEAHPENGVPRYTGVWRAGSFSHKLLVDAEWDKFFAKHREFVDAGFRLVDIETYTINGQQVYAGIWHEGSGAYQLLHDVDWNSFNTTRLENETRGLELIDVEIFDKSGSNQYIGVWRQGNTRQKIYVDVPWSKFRPKWQQFKGSGLILSDLEVRKGSGRTSTPVAVNKPAPAKPSTSPSSGGNSGTTPAPTAGQVERGQASYYGDRLHGNLTASGEPYNRDDMTAAHKTLPFGTIVKVTNTANNKSVTVRINDRGPYVTGRIIDLSYVAAEQVGAIEAGIINVTVEVVE